MGKSVRVWDLETPDKTVDEQKVLVLSEGFGDSSLSGVARAPFGFDCRSEDSASETTKLQ